MYTVKGYRNVTVLNANGDDFVEEERQVLNVEGVQGHAFGTFTFTLLKEGGACSVYRYDNYDRVDVEAIEPPVDPDAPVEAELVH